MLGLAKPRHFIPVHGEYRMLVQHACWPRGRRGRDRIFVLQNGQVVEFDGQRRLAGSVPAGAVLVDGLSASTGSTA